MALCVAAVLLATLHCMRLTIDRRWPRCAVLGMAVLVLAQIGLGVVVDRAGVERRSQLRQVIAGIQGGTPPLLLVGSSFSARSIDGDALSAGLGVEVGQLTHAGVFALEQDLMVGRYLEANPARLVLIELGTEFAGYRFQNGETIYLSPGYILHSDPVRTLWAYRLLWDQVDTMPAAEVAMNAVARAQAFAANVLHVGLLYQLANDREAPAKGYDPHAVTEGATVSADVVAAELNAAGEPGAIGAKLAFRRWQRDRLLALGARDVRFYEPPIADADRSATNRRLCLELGELCIAFDGIQTMPPHMWRDLGHVNERGAERYTQWLADRLRSEVADAVQ